MEDKVIPAQSTDVPAPAVQTPAAEPTVEELKAQLDQERREKQGMYNDLKSERARRQELERTQSTAGQSNGANDLGPQATDKVVDVVKPIYEEVASIKAQTQREKALTWFARKEKLEVEDPEQVLSAPSFKELQQVISDYHLGNMPIMDGVKAAHELLTVRRERAAKAAQAAEGERDKVVSSQQTNPGVGAPQAPSKVVRVSRSDIAKMSTSDYASLRDRAAKAGETILVE